MNGTQKVGDFWRPMRNQDLQNRQFCEHCNGNGNDVESMEHILLECTHPTRQLIWNLARQLWPHDDQSWPEIDLGIILGCGSISSMPQRPLNQEIDNARPQSKLRGPIRLLQITITETAHLIWALRCERVIQRKTHTNNEATARWLRAINKRLIEDKILATRIK
jgi:hypothetical protein